MPSYPPTKQDKISHLLCVHIINLYAFSHPNSPLLTTKGSIGHASTKSWGMWTLRLSSPRPHQPDKERVHQGILLFALDSILWETQNRIFYLPQVSQRLGAIRTGTTTALVCSFSEPSPQSVLPPALRASVNKSHFHTSTNVTLQH